MAEASRIGPQFETLPRAYRAPALRIEHVGELFSQAFSILPSIWFQHKQWELYCSSPFKDLPDKEERTFAVLYHHSHFSKATIANILLRMINPPAQLPPGTTPMLIEQMIYAKMFVSEHAQIFGVEAETAQYRRFAKISYRSVRAPEIIDVFYDCWKVLCAAEKNPLDAFHFKPPNATFLTEIYAQETEVCTGERNWWDINRLMYVLVMAVHHPGTSLNLLTRATGMMADRRGLSMDEVRQALVATQTGLVQRGKDVRKYVMDDLRDWSRLMTALSVDALCMSEGQVAGINWGSGWGQWTELNSTWRFRRCQRWVRR
jgi:hypothetical protein